MFEITIPLDARTKKNSPRTFAYTCKKTGKQRVLVLPSKAYEDFEKACMPFLSGIEKIYTPINLQAVFYMQTRRNVDLVGLLQSIDDVLVKAGVIADDCRDIVATHDGSEVLYDKNNPRIEITITKKENYTQWRERTAAEGEKGNRAFPEARLERGASGSMQTSLGL